MQEKSNDFDHIKQQSNKGMRKWQDSEVGRGGGEWGGGARKHKAWVNTARSASGTN